MSTKWPPLWNTVRENIIGYNAPIDTPFGPRKITYADYNASGRGISFIEKYLSTVLEHYSNTHTEDDATGAMSTAKLHAAEKRMKQLLNADDDYRIIEVGTGATGAIHRLQQILGIYIPPAAKKMFTDLTREALGEQKSQAYERFLKKRRPVVFVGPYEHHSNEVSWRECCADVVEIGLTEDGFFDLKDLEEKAADPAYAGRMKIGSFSAASNVTGLKTPVYEVAKIVHKHGGYVFFDYAASAPYVHIDVRKDDDCFFDGIFFSPHKFLGGPGSSGILIIHTRIYHQELPPVVGAGGTVDFVNAYAHIYNPDIEVREKPGTPGILQILKASLAMELKQRMDIDRIEERERRILKTVLHRFETAPNVEVMVPMSPETHLPIVSFNIKAENSYLHPRFVVKLLNDLFGIQARAGCSCAGPYGHKLLHIDDQTSKKFQELIQNGEMGIKPGWTRLSFHFIMRDEEVDFICRAVEFIGRCGKYFLPLYTFDIHSGSWTQPGYEHPPSDFGIDSALSFVSGLSGTGENEASETTPSPVASETTPPPAAETGTEGGHIPPDFAGYFECAERLAEQLQQAANSEQFKVTEKSLIPFLYV